MQMLVILLLLNFISANPALRSMPQLNPVMRYYRLKSQPADENSLPNERPVRATPLASSGRNCFFSPVQCRLPVSKVRSMDSSGQRLFLNDQPGLGIFDRMRRWNKY
ncbi:unnamed protein product [Bursaphelenchus xylophilus]|uniref:(pine wood nematode) hypothetical protein n=1 Tax=Bursaphelenchus xylophilus TaxID=6326 RepID=A0A1I7SME6_BURXY|nr:unnamed protein product [Bursaphelenchus xylophilus]CAG9130154.1 unnamed protein product [Bursaphelenchus xylophilus]